MSTTMKYKLILFGVLTVLCLQNLVYAQKGDELSEPDEKIDDKQKVATLINEISEKANEIRMELRQIESDLDSVSSFNEIEHQVPLLIDSLSTLSSDSLYENLNNLDARTLQSLGQEWMIYLDIFDNWETELSNRNEELENYSNKLQRLGNVWQAIQDSAANKDIPEAIFERVTLIDNRLDSISAIIDERINVLIVLQDLVSEEQIKIDEVIWKLKEAEIQKMIQVFSLDSPPIWEVISSKEDSVDFAGQFTNTWNSFLRSNTVFINTNISRFIIHLLIYLILLAFLFYLSWKNKKDSLFDKNDKALKASAFFVLHPFSAALLVALLLSVVVYSNPTASFSELIVLLFIIPMIRLIPGVFSSVMRKPIYYLFGLFALLIFQRNVADEHLLQRILLLLILFLSIAVLIWLIRPGSPVYNNVTKGWPRFLLRISPLVLVLLVLLVVANIVGAFSLANSITNGLLISIYLLVTIYVAVSIIDGMVTVFLRRRRNKAMDYVKIYAQDIERPALFIIHIFAFYIWIRASLKAFGLYKALQEIFTDMLATQWVYGTIVISVQDIFDFLLVIVFTFLIARFIRLFLDMEIFPRIRLPRGIPGAISMVVRYAVVAVGIILALSALGIDLGSFGLLAGAIGVGLGFGLQNVIANFVSGIILAFERPIQVGDVVEIGDVTGNVKQIGVRSSTVKAFDGSEVIVPNANFISNEVTNWTLTDANRRIKLPIKVAFGSNPHQVLELLLKVTGEHAGVLKSPEPIATFNGFGDNYLDFTLYYWVSENIFQTTTEVALGVHDIINEHKISTPRPQQDVNLKVLNSGKEEKYNE